MPKARSAFSLVSSAFCFCRRKLSRSTLFFRLSARAWDGGVLRAVGVDDGRLDVELGRLDRGLHLCGEQRQGADKLFGAVLRRGALGDDRRENAEPRLFDLIGDGHDVAQEFVERGFDFGKVDRIDIGEIFVRADPPVVDGVGVAVLGDGCAGGIAPRADRDDIDAGGNRAGDVVVADDLGDCVGDGDGASADDARGGEPVGIHVAAHEELLDAVGIDVGAGEIALDVEVLQLVIEGEIGVGDVAERDDAVGIARIGVDLIAGGGEDTAQDVVAGEDAAEALGGDAGDRNVVARERVRQLEQVALVKLRSVFEGVPVPRSGKVKESPLRHQVGGSRIAIGPRNPVSRPCSDPASAADPIPALAT